MKATLIALVVLGFATVTGAQTRNTLQLLDFKGPVKSVRTEKAVVSEVAGEKIESPRVLLSIDTFDRVGNRTRQAVSDPQRPKQWDHRWRHVYDSDKREIRTEYLDSRGRQTNAASFVYHDQGKRVVITVHSPQGVAGSGLETRHVRELFFDDQGNEVREVVRFPNGSMIDIVRTYNAQRKLTEEVHNHSGTFHHKAVWIYDDHANITSLTVHKPDGTIGYVYNQRFGYDRDGNITELIKLNRDNVPLNKETYTHVYDEYGNWTKRTILRQVFNATGSATEREILYRRIDYYGDARLARR